MWKVKDEYAEHEITIRDQVVEIKTKAKNLTEEDLYKLSIRGIDLYYMFKEVKDLKSFTVKPDDETGVESIVLTDSPPHGVKGITYKGVEPDKAEKPKKKPKGKK